MRSRLVSGLSSALFLLLAPGTMAGYVPWLITRWTFRPPFLQTSGTRVAGAVLIALGLTLLLDCFRRFAFEGRGTPAPVVPTERLVVSGAYRFVRNPMYVAVVSLILGQCLLFADPRLFLYAAGVWTLFHAFILLYEEPTLRARYGDSYRAYTVNVRRWIPRLVPWRGGT